MPPNLISLPRCDNSSLCWESSYFINFQRSKLWIPKQMKHNPTRMNIFCRERNVISFDNLVAQQTMSLCTASASLPLSTESFFGDKSIFIDILIREISASYLSSRLRCSVSIETRCISMRVTSWRGGMVGWCDSLLHEKTFFEPS